MGEAHRFQRPLIDSALESGRSVLAEFGLRGSDTVQWPGWRTVIDDTGEKTWIRADSGGLVDMHYDRGGLVYEDDVICTITNPFKTENTLMRAPFTGLLVGILENPLVYLGNPLCHLVRLDDRTQRAIKWNRRTNDDDW
jgi:predicted deacylase